MRDPSGMMSQVCTIGEPSLYQKSLIAWHQYFFPDDMCALNIETGALDCRALPASGCDQSATTTDCAKIIAQNPPVQRPTSVASTEVAWKTYSNDELSVSFSYPTTNPASEDWRVGKGTTGKAFQATIDLPSGAVIYAYALTKDYSAPKDGPGVATEGFVVKDGKYYMLIRGSVSETPFVPDEVWELVDGSNVLVTYGKNFDSHADYPESPAKAMVNLPGPTFTGIGFVLYNMDNSGPHPATPEDLAIFKKILTSIKFIQ